MEQLLISKADIQLYIEDIPATLDEKRLATYIREAQRRILKPLLTPTFYAAYHAAFGTSESDPQPMEGPVPVTPTPEWWEMLKVHITPVLVYHAWADYVLFSQGTATAYSYVRKTDQRSEPLDASTLSMINKRLKAIGDGYAADLIEHIRDNSASYPLYERNTCNATPGYSGGDTMQRI